MEIIAILISISSLIILFIIVNSVYQTMKTNEKIKIYTYMQTRILLELSKKEGIDIDWSRLYNDGQNA